MIPWSVGSLYGEIFIDASVTPKSSRRTVSARNEKFVFRGVSPKRCIRKTFSVGKIKLATRLDEYTCTLQPRASAELYAIQLVLPV